METETIKNDFQLPPSFFTDGYCVLKNVLCEETIERAKRHADWFSTQLINIWRQKNSKQDLKQVDGNRNKIIDIYLEEGKQEYRRNPDYYCANESFFKIVSDPFFAKLKTSFDYKNWYFSARKALRFKSSELPWTSVDWHSHR